MLRKLSRPEVLMPLVLSVALIGALLGVTDAPKVLDLVARISLPLVLLNFPLVVAYLALKSLQLRLFLNDIRIRVSWKQLLFAFASGEMSASVPGGMFLQNYVLRRVAGAGFARSSAATAAILVVEGGVSLVVLAILGIPGWGLLRPAILIFLVIAAAAILLLVKTRGLRDLLGRAVQAGPLRPIGLGAMQMAEELGRLCTPRVAARAALVGAAYLLAISAGLLVVAHGIGETTFTYQQAVTAYLFALAMVLLSPISSQLGMIEAGGVGVLQTMGYGPTDALAMMLGLRLVWTASVWMSCGLILLLLRGEWREPLMPQLAPEIYWPSRPWSESA